MLLTCGFRDSEKQEPLRGKICWWRTWHAVPELGRNIWLHIPICARRSWREKANPFHLLLGTSVIYEACLLLGPLHFMFPFHLNAWPPVAAKDVHKEKWWLLKGCVDKNYFDICFGCRTISAWVSVCHASISHDPESNTARGAMAFWYSDLLEQGLWTLQSTAQANNMLRSLCSVFHFTGTISSTGLWSCNIWIFIYFQLSRRHMWKVFSSNRINI